MSDDGFQLFGTDLFGAEIKQSNTGIIRQKFDFPPFTVLNAREGAWQERKRAWLACGIKSEVGRGDNLLKMSDTMLDPKGEKRAAARSFNMGLGASADNGWQREDDKGSGTSIFDPVLAELCYRWFCPPGGQILDPFAGGSVRGIVAGLLGFRYHGIDLRPEQIEANNAQREAIAPAATIEWVCGDSNVMLDSAPEADFIFSCPPYGDLEVYSDDPNDLSTMTYAQFLTVYESIICKSLARLRNNRFAAFVIGEYRDPKTGAYRGFVPSTCAAFMLAGADFYNEAVLVTSVGTLALRVTKQFEATRKLGKTHQTLLVFCKGDPKIATDLINSGGAK
jgi:DNA modification methylase